MFRLVFTVAFAAAGAWAFLAYQYWQMAHLPMAQMWMPPSFPVLWPLRGFLWVSGMWAAMMAAMMLPAALPVLAAFSRYCERAPSSGKRLTLWFASGYLTVWCAFAIVLTAMQWLFHSLAWLSPMMESRQPEFAAAILAIAGLYQFTPTKNACLQHCRTPFGFLLHEWRPGKAGALRTGIKHGMHCLGCCWAQMLVMFAVGVMNLLGMALITLLVIAEKCTPAGGWKPSYYSGLLFLVWSTYLLIAER